MQIATVAHFRECLEALGVTQDGTPAYAALVARYSEPHRAYHNWSHIEACMRHLAENQALAARPAELALALYFHDAVYCSNPLRNNEKESARLAAAQLRSLGVPEDSIRRIEAMILATKTHQIRDDLPADLKRQDLALCIDIDLAILSGDAYALATFEAGVRKEYAWVPEWIYRGQRQKTLKRILRHTTIYHTPAMAARAPQARRNLQKLHDQIEDAKQNGTLVDEMDATERCIFSSSAGRLVESAEWSEIVYIKAIPSGTGPRFIFVSLDAAESRAFAIMLDVAQHAPLLTKLRQASGYQLEEEAKAWACGEPSMVFEAKNGARLIPQRAT
jgi:predicted metal-dependent HD superfamily phosphohydrolase